MPTHNPKEATEQLQKILSSPSKKIGFLFGAGISMKKADGSDLIVGSDDQTGTKVKKEGMTSLAIKKLTLIQKNAIELINKEISAESKRFNIETLLSKISEKERAAGNEKLCGLTKAELKKLREDLEKEVQVMVSVHSTNDTEETNHNIFAKWVKNADREFPVEIFTTNYDYFLELAFEKQRVPYFDGFVGSYEAFFCPEWIESDSPVKNWTKLWKLHGSLGWSQNEEREIIRTSSADGTAMIYPSYLKYDQSKKQPYLSYMDRLSRFLQQEDSVLLVCGYSFGDDHINEIITTSLARSRSSHCFVLKNGDLKNEDPLATNIAHNNLKISVYSGRTAVIGGKFGEWMLPSKEGVVSSFVEDKAKSDDAWDGYGKFLLGDFKEFTNFLSDFYKKYNA